VAQSKLLYGLRQVLGLTSIDGLGPTVLNCTELAVTRAGAAQNKEGRRLLPETLTYVGASGLLADGGQ